MKEKWFIQTKKADFYSVAKKFNISPILARIIRNRDVITDEEIETYLNPDITKMHSPWLFKDMDKAVDILKIKISSEQKIRIIADYDADGICSGYILQTALTNLNALVDVVIPHRIEDGYGISDDMVKKAYDDGVDTILTCDNGIAAVDQIELAKKLGMTVIVTDHHEIPFEEIEGQRIYVVPKADAVIDHKQEDCPYPFKELCGAMVAYKLMSALYESMGRSQREIMDLLVYGAIATVCDIMELKEENRIIVKYGLQKLRTNNDIGLNALIETCGVDKGKISTYHFGFVIGPCLNASGRLDSAKKAIDLLNAKNYETAKIKATELKKLNDERKDMTEKGSIEAIEIAENMTDKVLIIYLPQCHESIAGIIAGRVKDKYNKPTIVLTDGEQDLKGSARSIEQYDMYEEITKVRHLLTKFGGHKMAAGLSLNRENLELLRKELNENCNLTEEDLYLKVWIDMQLPLEYVTMNLIKELDKIEPFGKGNLAPIFAEKNLKIKKLQIVGKTGNVVKVLLENQEGFRMEGIVFKKSQTFMKFLMDKFGEIEVNKAMKGDSNILELTVAYYPSINEFNGNIKLQLVIERFC